MHPVDWFAIIIVAEGAFGAYQFFTATLRANTKKSLRLDEWITGMLLVAGCAYPGILYGGQIFRLWTITPEWGRPGLILALLGLVMISNLIMERRS